MNDLISRQVAIDAIEREKSLIERPITEIRWFDLGLGKAQDVLSELPSAQPEQRTGKWMQDWYGAWVCSECKEPCASQVMGKPRDRFCKWCGSRNEVTL